MIDRFNAVMRGSHQTGMARFATSASIVALAAALTVALAGMAPDRAAHAGDAVAPKTLSHMPARSPFAAQKAAAIKAAFKAKFGTPAIEYLESIAGTAGATFRPPSELDPRFTMALYVNAAARGKTAQRMWMLQRDELGGPWRLAMWDKGYWRRQGLPAGQTPPFSWNVSTGRKYRGDRRSGPTPTGVFGIDERRYRMSRGYHAPGMINVAYIDLHYSSGRRSGVAFHGTTRGRYRVLGRIDSHGCIRMTQANALALINRMQGRDGVLSEAMRYGEVPRFWKSESRGRRWGYRRDGVPHALPQQVASNAPADASSELTGAGEALLSDAAPSAQFPSVLTKTGYRAVTVIFKN